MAFVKKLTAFGQNVGLTLKSLIKIAVESRRCGIKRIDDVNVPLIIMGNGPSLADTMRDFAPQLDRYPTLAVNFAANAGEFYRFKPDYYVMVDPEFFRSDPNQNVVDLWQNLRTRIDWPMTLFVPAAEKKRIDLSSNPNLRVETFNPVGVEGFEWIENCAFASGRGMPRPRNVLIVSLMVALKMGYKEIYLVGADHSWTKTLDVTEENIVVSVQPHFYKDNETERKRSASVYRNVRVHEIMYSFYVAFKSYFAIERFARKKGVDIYNATPGSFIDAFRRRQLPD